MDSEVCCVTTDGLDGPDERVFLAFNSPDDGWRMICYCRLEGATFEAGQ